MWLKGFESHKLYISKNLVVTCKRYKRHSHNETYILNIKVTVRIYWGITNFHCPIFMCSMHWLLTRAEQLNLFHSLVVHVCCTFEWSCSKLWSGQARKQYTLQSQSVCITTHHYTICRILGEYIGRILLK